MREIKFRGKRLDNGEWVHGFYLYGSILDEHIIWTDNENWKVDPETVGQCFGLRDYSENILFPGDIIKTKHTKTVGDDFPPEIEEYEKVGVIEYYHGYMFGPRLKWKKGHLMIPNTSTLWRMKAEIIGNIYENPELLQ